jgi:seryl-tRNA synthetase
MTVEQKIQEIKAEIEKAIKEEAKIAETEEAIKAIKAKIAELEKAIKEAAEKPKGIQLNTGNYRLYGDGDVDSMSLQSQKHKDVNNCWLTEQQAREARNIMSAIFELKQLCDITNEGWKPDFENGRNKYFISFDYLRNDFCMSSNTSMSHHSFYFRFNYLDKILPIMSDNLKAYIKGEL